jgi:hypothetical protein
MPGRHLTIQLTTFRRHETTMDVRILKKRTTTRTRNMGRVPVLQQECKTRWSSTHDMGGM